MDVRDQAVAADRWHAHVAELVAEGASMLDFLTAVDDPPAGQVEVVVHLVDVDRRSRHLVRARVDRAGPRIDSLADLLPGASWHERETHEMLGVEFVGNPDLRPLLTTGGPRWPLRRTTPLPARLQTPWPGAADPADRPPPPAPGAPAPRQAARPRTRPGPPGVPAEWHQDGPGRDGSRPGPGAGR